MSCTILGSDSFMVGINVVLDCKLDLAVFKIDSNKINAATVV